ncbi:hypothetical protein AAU57_11435 [Nonlabens sp. YIK11]|uniref:hypothetical protein n=1 Tax=Nonlabens sp. YIK11 TaxID=1453349 RepID=UPI0006DC4C84|nr:hypothetical protein [Nonlabens sp. YIK11]KQC33872.1 hypothetical protein AAU57_11435 [Nonlabens sp. YIK11]
MKKILCLFFLFSICSHSQSDLEILGYNLLLGTLTGGFGSAINKSPEQKWNEAFSDGAWKGAVGGTLLYSSKKLIAEVNSKEEWHLAWSSKIIHDSGASIIENAAANRPMFDQVNFNLGFVRNEFRFKNGVTWRPLIKPLSMTLTIYSAIGNDFDTGLSLAYGTPIFIRDDERLPNAFGITHGNAIVLRESFKNNFSLINHEMVHVFQLDEYAGLNNLILPQRNRWIKNEAYDKITDLFYVEYHSLFYYSFYFLDELIQGRGFNLLEAEAYNFSDSFRR